MLGILTNTIPIAPTVAQGTSHQLCQASEHQTSIGWGKLWLGMFALSWKQAESEYVCTHLTRKKFNDEVWLAKTTSLFLNFGIQCWQYGHEFIHGKSQLEWEAKGWNVPMSTTALSEPPRISRKTSFSINNPLNIHLKQGIWLSQTWTGQIAHYVCDSVWTTLPAEAAPWYKNLVHTPNNIPHT